MTAQATTRRIAWPLRRWPAIAGFAFAAVVLYDLVSGADLAAVIAASAVVYLGAAALRKPAAAWPLFFATVVVITVAKFLNDRVEATWVLFGLGAALLVYGLIRGAIRPGHGLPLQTLALLAFGAVAAVALLVDPTVGSYLVAAGLLGHAGWDLYHHRKNRVVARSLAEFCMALDATLAVVIVVLTAIG